MWSIRQIFRYGASIEEEEIVRVENRFGLLLFSKGLR